MMNIERKLSDKELAIVYSKAGNINYVRNAVDPEKYDEYRKIWDAATNLESVPSFPPQIDFELNYSCNFSCINCTWNLESKIKHKDTLFPFEAFKEIIDESVPKGLMAIRLNYLNEPLMRNDLDKFIAYARKAGILDIYFSTNGSLLTEKISRKIIKSGLTRIQISIDAYTNETYNKIRLGGDLDKIKANINNFIKIKKEMNSNLPTVRVNFVKTPENEHELQDFIDYWSSKVDNIGVQDLVNIIGTKKISNRKAFNCNVPSRNLVIRYDGTILPCCSFFGAEMPVSLLKTDISLPVVNNIGLVEKERKSKLIIRSLEDTWNSKEMCDLREMHKKGEYRKNPICKKCIEQ